MVRQKSSREGDSWELAERDDGLWVSRDLDPSWRVEHRLIPDGTGPAIAEMRIRLRDGVALPPGGLGSDVIRLATLRGARDAAMAHAGGPSEDLRALESLTPSASVRGEAQRYKLAIAALAYVRAVRAGSTRPNEDAAAALGLSARAVRDRLYAARRGQSPLLTGAGRRGVVGTPRLTAAGERAITARMQRIGAALGLPLAKAWEMRGDFREFVEMAEDLVAVAETQVPGFRAKSIEEIARAAGAPLPEGAVVPDDFELIIGPVRSTSDRADADGVAR